MRSYEVNILCSTEGCDAIESSMTHLLSLDTPAIAEAELVERAQELGWDTEKDLCPDCVAKQNQKGGDLS